MLAWLLVARWEISSCALFGGCWRGERCVRWIFVLNVQYSMNVGLNNGGSGRKAPHVQCFMDVDLDCSVSRGKFPHNQSLMNAHVDNAGLFGVFVICV